MTPIKLSVDDRRALILAKLSGEDASDLAQQYGITVEWVLALAREARKECKQKEEDALREWIFRLAVVRVVESRRYID